MQNADAALQARNTGPVRNILIWLAAGLSVLCIGAPLAVIFSYAFSKGIHVFFSEILKPDTLHAVWLTVLTAIVVVPINMAFGVCVAWLVTKFRFPGRRLLITFVEIPFSVSPIVAGVTYLFLYGSQGLLGPFLEAHDIKIMFTVPAIFLVSLFVTSPFVAGQGCKALEPAVPAGHGFGVCRSDQQRARHMGGGRAACQMCHQHTAKTMRHENRAGIFGQRGFKHMHPIGQHRIMPVVLFDEQC